MDDKPLVWWQCPECTDGCLTEEAIRRHQRWHASGWANGWGKTLRHHLRWWRWALLLTGIFLFWATNEPARCGTYVADPYGAVDFVERPCGFGDTRLGQWLGW